VNELDTTPVASPPADTPDDAARVESAPAIAPAEDDIYDAAMRDLLGSPGQTAPAPEQTRSDAAPAPADAPAGDGGLAWSGLNEQDRQTLSRSKIDQQMFEAWSPDQRRAFLDHQSKRERDQSDSYRKLTEQNAKLQQELEERQRAKDDGDYSAEQPSDQVESSVSGVIEELVDTYGEEMRPLQRAFESMQDRINQLEGLGHQAPVMQRVIAELTMKTAINDLAPEYPSLRNPEARETIEQKFSERWAESKHRQDVTKPMIERISAELRDIARDEYGSVPENADTASLIDRNRERLAQQPVVGFGKGRPAPVTEDDIMDQAFAEHLAPALRNRF